MTRPGNFPIPPGFTRAPHVTVGTDPVVHYACVVVRTGRIKRTVCGVEGFGETVSRLHPTDAVVTCPRCMHA